MMTRSILSLLAALLLALTLTGCAAPAVQTTPTPTARTVEATAPATSSPPAARTVEATAAVTSSAPTPKVEEFTAEQVTTLRSLKQVDDYPLYTMTYVGSYADREEAYIPTDLPQAILTNQGTCEAASWGCSLFAALGDPEDRLYGRNFDWQFSPAVLLFTDPPEGYASVSMVDIDYLGFSDDGSRNLGDLPLEELRNLLDAPLLPFDGMNEKGLAVGMAAVTPGSMTPDPQKRTIGQLQAIREMLDHAATVDEAVAILGSYNIDMGRVPIHYLVASSSGDSALVEFHHGEMHVFHNELPWQHATNFLLAAMDGRTQGQCRRYDLIQARLSGSSGILAPVDAMALLHDVSQDNTQWSVVYHMTTGDLEIVMGRRYEGTVHSFNLAQPAP